MANKSLFLTPQRKQNRRRRAENVTQEPTILKRCLFQLVQTNVDVWFWKFQGSRVWGAWVICNSCQTEMRPFSSCSKIDHNLFKQKGIEPTWTKHIARHSTLLRVVADVDHQMVPCLCLKNVSSTVLEWVSTSSCCFSAIIGFWCGKCFPLP